MSTLKVNAIEPYSGDTVTTDAKLNFQEGKGIHLFENNFGAGETPSYLRFYSGSTAGVNYINMQNEPNGNGRVTISAFPANNHFFFLDPSTHITEFDGQISGYAGNNLRISGDAVITGSLNNQFAAPGTWSGKPFTTVTGASISGKSYSNVVFQFADFSPFGANFEDYFGIEYYDSFGYNYGSEFDINGKQTRLSTYASGSMQGSEIRTTDNYDGTSQISLDSIHVVVPQLGNYADDTAAAAGGVKVNGLYRSGSQVMIRVS